MDKCKECGMPVTVGEYHPYAACLMFKSCQDSDIVQANLDAVQAHGYQLAIDVTAKPKQPAPQVVTDPQLEQALSDYWDAAYAEGQAGATGDKDAKAQTAWTAIKKRIDDNERWMSQAHIMCTDLGIPQGHIEDRLFDAIDRLHDLIRLKENLPDLLEYVTHDSWRCGYDNKCFCGLNDLTDKLGLERVPLPAKGEKT